jgi:hypothetical protein
MQQYYLGTYVNPVILEARMKVAKKYRIVQPIPCKTIDNIDDKLEAKLLTSRSKESESGQTNSPNT